MTIDYGRGKITAQHLERKAVVYLRQSSPRQARENRESQLLQYALADRARELGWRRVEVIDVDLGSSAAWGAAPRAGFNEAISSVALGDVGIVFSREVARLSRTDKDFCQLLEVCQLFGVLIGDDQTIYDPNLLDDQLILGIKGTLSVVELKILKMRMLEGMVAKAKRGELVRLLAPGYARDPDERIVKDPDRRVQEAIALVFRKFREMRSIRQTHIWFLDHAVELPVNKSRGGCMELVWQLPTRSFLRSVLENPVYAGAYVWGQRPTEMVVFEGRVRKRQGSLRKPEECKVFIRDHHEGYIDWRTYEENLRMIRSNSLRYESGDSTAAARPGKGILAGLLRCGRCGRKLYVMYVGKRGTHFRYLCKGAYDAGGRYCLGFGGSKVDRRFGEELLRVISPWGVRAALEALEQVREKDDDEKQALCRQLEQMEYEATRAFEQYNEVDPRNRLAALELERRWNAKLQELEALKSALAAKEEAAPRLGEEAEARILALGADFSVVWGDEGCPAELKKKILRTVVREVVVDSEDGNQALRFTIHWKGGAHTQFTMDRPMSGAGEKTALEDVEIIRKMAPRHSDERIAAVLNRLGRRTGKGNPWSKCRVLAVRRRSKIRGHVGPYEDPELLSLAGAAKHCKVSQTAIKRLVAHGLLTKEQVCPWAPWEIRRADLEAEPVREILSRLRRTRRLVLEGGDSYEQLSLPAKTSQKAEGDNEG